MKLLALVAGCLLLMACGGRPNGERMSSDDDFQAAWQAVQSADSASEQRQKIDAFLAMNQRAGAPPLQVSVRNQATGEKAPIDQALWDNPQQFEVTLRYGERRYVFVPLSRSSLEPLFRE